MTTSDRIKPAVKKSVIGAFLLAFLAGPLGALYVGVKFAAIYLVVGIGVGAVTAGFGAIFVWMVYCLYSPEMVSRQNKAEIDRVRLAEQEIQEEQTKLRLEEKRHQELLRAVKQGNLKSLTDVEL